MRQTKGEKIFSVCNYIILTLISFVTLYPFIYVLAASFSIPDEVIKGNVWFFPKGFELASYKETFSQEGIWCAYANTIFYTLAGTMVNLFVTICGAYALSKKRLVGRKALNLMVIFTMWFHAGMIPFYLNIRRFGLLDTRTGILIAFACSAFYVILIRTYFESIPSSMEESASIDGANDLVILVRIYLPMSVPALATIGLYYAVARWNTYLWPMILLKNESKIPLQVLLNKLIVQMNVDADAFNAVDVVSFSKETVIYATIIIAIMPMLLAYPWIQKYFIKGIMIGAIKG